MTVHAALFGCFALFLTVIAVGSLIEKYYAAGAICGVIGFLSMIWSTYNWRIMLVSSGKNPFLFGIYRYPYVALPCIVLLAVSLCCVVIGAVHAKKRGSGKVLE